MNTVARPGTRSLRGLLDGFAVAPELPVSGIAMDSRRVTPGDLFLACRGSDGRHHGLDHVSQAQARGAVAVAWEPADGHNADAIVLPQVAVAQLAARAGEIAARFHGRPSQTVACIGVTGTDGKTSTAYLLAQALQRLGTPCAYVGTIGAGLLPQLDTATHTTPDPVGLQALLADMRDRGAQACALEVSSHALDQQRTSGLHFGIAVLTNLTRDHLDYHGTVERYAAAKRRLFEQVPAPVSVLNRDDEHGARWARELAATRRVLSYGIEGPAGEGEYVLARALRLTPQGLSFEIDSSWGSAQLQSRLLGRFNVYNLLAALACLLLRGVELDAAVRALAASQTVPGRIEAWQGPRAEATVVVDYAHTPDALRQVLSALRAHAPRRLICVFGCGGDRDAGKRPLMGAVAAALADRVVVTDDNPRSESPLAIVEAIVAGVPLAQRGKLAVQHDRARAIADAVMAAQAGDVVLVAGKGHEEYQIHGSQRRDFSDRRLVAELLGAAP